MRTDLLTWLRCSVCAGRLAPAESAAPDGTLRCDHCGRSVPIVDGIPRFVDEPKDAEGRRTQASFGYEWTHFNDWRPSGDTNFNDYFAGIDLKSLDGLLVLDAGCGMGRHARQVAAFAGRVIAVDFSQAIDQAARNTADSGNVDCVQGDLLALPLADSTFDFVYSLGVLHHLDDTIGALGGLVRKLRPGGRLRVYLYWKRHGWKGRLLTVATIARTVTTKMPFALLRACCQVLSVGLFGLVVMPYRLLSRMGVRIHEEWPLFVYSKYPFNVLYNDQFDRFSAPVEKRYDPNEVKQLLENVGLVNVSVRSCFGWVADGTKPV